MNASGRSLLFAAVCLTVCVVLGGCTMSRGKAVPHEVQNDAVVHGFGPEIRTWGMGFNPAFGDRVLASVEKERAELARRGHEGEMPAAEFLAISGGGSNGAFGAGMLCAWSDAGTRPEFKLVTGISTGALTAPFAFCGSKYDHVLREVYTKTKTSDILEPRSLLNGMTSDAMADTAPLWKLMSKHVNEELMADIAAEYAKGRVLIVGTTNLDARRAVLWNIGEIASSGRPGSIELVRKILIASAAIPGAFPPVFIDVDVDGQKFQEMHVDGGAMTQVFLYPPTLKLREEMEGRGLVRERRAYIIRNARLDPDWAEVQRSTMSIAMRAVDSLLQTQGVGDLYRMYANAHRDGVDYNLAYIPADFKETPKEAFDPVYMSALFQRGYDMTRNGYPWQKTPPGFDGVPGEPSAPAATGPDQPGKAEERAGGRGGDE